MKMLVVIAACATLAALVWWTFGAREESAHGVGLHAAVPAGRVELPERELFEGDLVLPEEDDAYGPPEAFAEEQREAIAADANADVFGRVREKTSGAPLADLVVTLRAGEKPLAATRTDVDGAFSFARGRSDQSELTVRIEAALGWVVEEPSRRIAADDSNVRLEFRARRWPPEVAGDITGWLRAESGGFARGVLARDRIVLDLVSTEHPPITRRGEIEAVRNAKGQFDLRFLFEDVPAGEYNLTLSSLTNFRWVPSSLLVTPPAAGIELLCYDLDEALALEFEVFDARSRERILVFDARHIKQTSSPDHGVLLHTGPIEGESFPLDVPFTWSLEAPGYATAYGNAASFTVEDGRRVARVYLERGWSTRFLVMGGVPYEPLVGAELYLDGELVGATGVDGALNAKAGERPGQIDVRYRDWVLAEPVDLAGASFKRRRSRVTPVLLEEPE